MWWHLKSPASRLLAQPFIQVQITENIKALRHWPMCGELTSDRWVPRTNAVTQKMFPFDDVIMWFKFYRRLFVTDQTRKVWLQGAETTIGNPIVKIRRSYLHNGISYTDKMTSLYWIRAQIICDCVSPPDSIVGSYWSQLVKSPLGSTVQPRDSLFTAARNG